MKRKFIGIIALLMITAITIISGLDLNYIFVEVLGNPYKYTDWLHTWDKEVHALIFGLLSVFIYWIRMGKTITKNALYTLIAIIFFSTLDEYHQSLTPNRNAGYDDAIANIVGCLIALFFCIGFDLWRKSQQSKTKDDGEKTETDSGTKSGD